MISIDLWYFFSIIIGRLKDIIVLCLTLIMLDVTYTFFKRFHLK